MNYEPNNPVCSHNNPVISRPFNENKTGQQKYWNRQLIFIKRNYGFMVNLVETKTKVNY